LDLIRKEGYLALYKGLFPRLMRVGVGQAVTFASYERIKIYLEIISQKGLFGAAEESI
jgi:solute carrier family 25 (mitochondrial citrate transporter), member 1